MRPIARDERVRPRIRTITCSTPGIPGPTMAPHATPDRLLAEADWARALARRLVADETAADDVVQEVWLDALRRPPEAHRPVRPWLAQVVRNAARQLRRGEARRRTHEQGAPPQSDVPSAREVVEKAEVHRALVDAVLALAEPERHTVLLRYFEGSSAADIASHEGIPASTVRWRLQKALGCLRERLRERFGDARGLTLALLPLCRVSRLPTPPSPSPSVPAAASPAAAVLLGGALLSKQIVSWAGGIAVVALGIWVGFSPRARSASPTANPAAAQQVVSLPADDSRSERERLDSAPARTPIGTPVAPPTVSPTATVTGRVVDADDTPVFGAAVLVRTVRNHTGLRIDWDDNVLGSVGGSRVALVAAGGVRRVHGGFVTSTDPSGRFTVPSLGEIALTVAASHEDHGFAAVDVPSELEAHQAITLRLDGCMRFSGRVIDDRGQPVAGAELLGYGPTAMPSVRAQSGPDGTYRTPLLEPGRWCLSVTKPGYRAVSTEWIHTNRAPAVVRRDVTLVPYADRTLELLDRNGNRWTREALELRGFDATRIEALECFVTLTEPATRHEVDVDPNEWRYDDKGFARGKSRSKLGQREFLSVWCGEFRIGLAAFDRTDSDQQSVTVDIEAPRSRAQLRVTLRGDVPPEGLTVVLSRVGGAMPWDWNECASRSGVSDRTEFDLPAFTGPQMFVLSIRDEQRRCKPVMVLFERPPASGTELSRELTVTNATSSLSGTVLDTRGEPVWKATVGIRGGAGEPLFDPRHAFVRTDDHGRFTFDRVPLGELRLFVQHPEHGKLAADVRVGEQSRNEVTLRFRGSRRVELRLPNDSRGRQIAFLDALGRTVFDDRFFGVVRHGSSMPVVVSDDVTRIEVRAPFEEAAAASGELKPGSDVCELH